MDMYENLEQPSRIVKDLSQTSELRQVELDYIKECVCPPRPEELVDRIDDIQGGQPPKALDADPRIAELIEPVNPSFILNIFFHQFLWPLQLLTS